MRDVSFKYFLIFFLLSIHASANLLELRVVNVLELRLLMFYNFLILRLLYIINLPVDQDIDLPSNLKIVGM